MDRLFTIYHSKSDASCIVAYNKTLRNRTILKMVVQLLPLWFLAHIGSASSEVNAQTDKTSNLHPYSPFKFLMSEHHYREINKQQTTFDFTVQNNKTHIDEIIAQKTQRGSSRTRQHKRPFGNAELVSSRRRRSNSGGHHRRHFRGMQRRSCKTISKYVFKNEVEDMFGNKVKLHPSIHIGPIAVDQYLYESYCDKEQCQCTGINTNKFASSCETDYRLTLARVVVGGEVGWSHVKVRSGCSCVINEKHRRRQSSILDLL